ELLVEAARERLRVRENIGDDLGEERLLVTVVVVHGALREPGERRDLLHRRAGIALTQEQRPRRIDDGRARPDDARVARALRRGASLPPRDPRAALGYCTHE